MKLLIMQSSPDPRHFLPLRSNLNLHSREKLKSYFYYLSSVPNLIEICLVVSKMKLASRHHLSIYVFI